MTRPFDGLSFEASGAQIVLARGPSGSGKTTLLSVLAGLLTPRSGHVVCDGVDVTGLDGRALLEHRRTFVGVVFQAFNLVPSLSAVENVMAPLILTGTRTSEARTTAMELLDRVSLTGHAHQRPGTLSGGQQQRVAFARALVRDPPLILADEPTAHLDPDQVESVLRLISDLRRPGRVIVISTHDARFDSLADRLVQMDEASGVSVGERR